MERERVQLVWFKRDLRTQDHLPLTEACKAGKVLCFYLDEPTLIRSPEWNLSHSSFLNDSLVELEKELSKLKIQLYRFRGEAVEILNQIHQKCKVDTLWSHQETGNALTFERDKRVKAWCLERKIPWKEYAQFGVIRGLKDRNGWARQWNEFMSLPQALPPKKTDSFSQNLSVGEPLTVEVSKCNHPLLQRGGQSNAWATLESFLQTRGRFYSKEMSSPNTAWEACSRLSPYFSFGNISLRQVWQAVELQRVEGLTESGWKASLAAFSSRLRWHCHFIQKLEDEPAIEFQNMNREMDGLRETEFNSQFFEAWKKGETGYPLIDACMRALERTGWINFRMRAMLVSFSSYHLWLHWREPALFLAKRFLDFEPGIHFSQIQMQSGTTGINAIRIYSPGKQVLDHDPKGEFIKKWIPELEGVPPEYLADPSKMNASLQKKAGCFLGKNYPKPIVDHGKAYSEAKRRIFSWRAKKEVREASKKVFLKHGSRKKRNSRAI